MKKNYTKLAFLAMLCFLTFESVQAQTVHPTAIAGSVTLTNNPGGTTNRSGVAYNPTLQLYYSVNAGSSNYPIQTFDASGTMINDVTSGQSYRGLWWNDALSQLEANTIGGDGIFTIALDANGYASSTNSVLFVGQNQPDVQSVGDLDYDANEIIYYFNGSIYRYDRTNAAALGNYTLNNIPATATLNTNTVMYTGVTGLEIAVYDYTNQKILLFDKATGNYAAESQLPVTAPTPSSFRMSYANNMVWLYDNTSWLSYEILQFCPTISLDNNADVTCSGGSDGMLNVSASGGSGGVGIYISEVNLNTPDFIEITSNGTIDVTGYQVVTSDSYTSITTANTLTWQLSGTMTANTPMYREDATGTNYWGNNLFYSSGNPGWAIIIDVSGNIIDAMFWGWTPADISTFSINVGGLTVTNNGAWTGDGVNNACLTSITRSGGTDTNTDVDWTCGAETKGVDNLLVTDGNVSPTLTYLWSSGETTDSITGLAAGTYTVTVSDGGLCSVVDSFVVGTIADVTLPTVVTQDMTIQLDASGNATIDSSDIDNGSSDNCSIASATLDINAFTCANIGTNTVTLTITDGSGNINTGTATVTVQDMISPTVTTQDITINLDANASATITANDVVTASNDNCSVVSTTLDITSFTDLEVGANTVTVTVTDPSGNTGTATAIVTVEYAVNTTGIQAEDILIRAYPNPTLDLIRLQMTNINEPTVLATLLDINGRVINTYQLETQDARIDVSDLPQGNYFIRIQTKEIVKTVKFMKQ